MPQVEESLDAIVEWMDREGKGVVDLIALLDDNGDGVLSHSELLNGLNKHILGIESHHAELLLKFFDCDGSGTIDFKEMCRAIDAHKRRNEEPDMSGGEELVTLYKGLNCKLYRITVETCAGAITNMP